MPKTKMVDRPSGFFDRNSKDKIGVTLRVLLLSDSSAVTVPWSSCLARTLAFPVVGLCIRRAIASAFRRPKAFFL